MTLQLAARPEDRHRIGVDSRAWADTHPACFRSEAFAEDLHEADAAHETAPLRRWPLTKPGSGGSGGLPLLGLTLAGMLGALVR